MPSESVDSILPALRMPPVIVESVMYNASTRLFISPVAAFMNPWESVA